MKKLLITLTVIVLGAISVSAQNIQLHYDFGHDINPELLKDRPLTSTVEMFRPDKLGSTFFFIDMDYTSKGVQMAYWEIFREFNLGANSPFAAHIEYNGGLNTYGSFGNSFLLGLSYNYNSSDFSKGFSFCTMYKYIKADEKPHNIQFTLSWYYHFLKNKLMTFDGFADFWTTAIDKNIFSQKQFSFLTEPQIWLNLAAFERIPDSFHLSVGSEIECSYNFYSFGKYAKKFYCNPTLAVKWTF